MILDVEATRSIRQAEVGSVRTMIDRVSETFALQPERLIADTAYGTGEMLDWLDRQRGIAPHIPVFDKSRAEMEHSNVLTSPTMPSRTPTPVRAAKC